MNPVELIRKKRDGQPLKAEEIQEFFSAYQQGKIADYQVSAMLMAMFFRPLNQVETRALCHTMIHSGKVLELSAIRLPKIDKHSTGGVGDKTSLILAPILASLDVAVPMISGRGLGHTGGTLDKLESIPGFRVSLAAGEFQAQLQRLHCALIGQTEEIAPLDKLLYALRDVTATVESIPLIAASIMSKKIASGLDGLVLDVKTGSGAFMPTLEKSRELAKTLKEIGEGYGKKVMAFITDMNEPLGFAVGNWLEVQECVDCLKGEKVRDLMDVSLALSGAMLLLAQKCESLEAGMLLAEKQVQNGKALAKFLEIVEAQGGDRSVLEDGSRYPKSRFCAALHADKSGWISQIDAREVGLCSTLLGAGRLRKEDAIDPKAGIRFHQKIGDRVQAGQIILEIFTDREVSVQPVLAQLNAAIQISPEHVQTSGKKVLEMIG
ncbi:pyrimidine-nucleoside phosphorylase [Chloroherpeton thalassium ATCC 35110]|uniref:thymidine phosphorylase n=1 Tax=Chloroherpeton thalassium (strain ATCC 35110 / GB-78) TaxID=517418 RepID=B3QVM5_CHLT3|nr:thymidine phosphorylase [Chloroherpeton thalassium]ACF13082.1 pyrimidine-nucleoside phosphorylase [Chloroherpeton thalassium ATCC 35110]